MKRKAAKFVEISLHKRCLFELSPILTVVYLHTVALLSVLCQLRAILSDSDDIVGFITKHVDSNFKSIIFLNKDMEYIPLFVTFPPRSSPLLHFPQPPSIRVQEITFGWNRSGNFTYRVSDGVSKHPRPLVFTRLEEERPALTVPPFFCNLPTPTETEDDSPPAHRDDYEDFDTGDASSVSADESSFLSDDSSDEDYVGPKEKKPRQQRWRDARTAEGKDPDVELFKLLAEQHEANTCCEDTPFCMPRKLPVNCFASFRRKISADFPVREVTLKDYKDKRLRGAYVGNASALISRVLEQWLLYGCSLPASGRLHFQLGADAKSELPIREGHGKVWSLWLRLVNIGGPLAPQTPRRAVIVAVVFGSDSHGRLQQFLANSDVPAQISRMTSEGIQVGSQRFAVDFTCTGDLPAVFNLQGIKHISPQFPSTQGKFAAFFLKVLCSSCLRSPAEVYNHPCLTMPSIPDLTSVLSQLLPVPADRFVYGYLHGTFHLATCVISDCGLYAIARKGEAAAKEHAFVKAVDQLFLRSRTVGGQLALWNPFRWRAVSEEVKKRGGGRPLRAADPGPVISWVLGGGLSTLARSAMDLDGWMVPKNGDDAEFRADVPSLLRDVELFCKSLRATEPAEVAKLFPTSRRIYRSWMAMMPVACKLDAHKRRSDWPRPHLIYDIRKGAFGPASHKSLCQSFHTSRLLVELGGGSFAEVFGEYWLEAAQMLVARCISKFDIPCRHRTTQCRHLLQRLIESCLTLPLRQSEDQTCNLSYAAAT